jgi:hypothetical protein
MEATGGKFKSPTGEPIPPPGHQFSLGESSLSRCI